MPHRIPVTLREITFKNAYSLAKKKQKSMRGHSKSRIRAEFQRRKGVKTRLERMETILATLIDIDSGSEHFTLDQIAEKCKMKTSTFGQYLLNMETYEILPVNFRYYILKNGLGETHTYEHWKANNRLTHVSHLSAEETPEILKFLRKFKKALSSTLTNKTSLANTLGFKQEVALSVHILKLERIGVFPEMFLDQYLNTDLKKQTHKSELLHEINQILSILDKEKA